jgi:hypothetical protein
MNVDSLCEAIRSRSIVQFEYFGDKTAGPRTVEPHMVAYNAKGKLALSAWYLGGASESQEGQGWREYVLSSMIKVTILDEKFDGPRPGYQPFGGKPFRNVQCGL